MTKPYGVMSDLHAHQWTAFVGKTKEGMNTRLVAICEEINRCCRKVVSLGGNELVIAGDVFHTRGNVSPSVFNPVKQTLEYWVAEGITVSIIPGNHDLESRDSDEISSAVKMLEAPGIEVFHKSQVVGTRAFVPWHASTKALIKALEEVRDHAKGAGYALSGMDLFIHAGIDGVLKGVPAHGLTADMLADLGFGRVFAGHYHHHVHMGRGVWSIGSPTHQTWSDVGTKSGWLIVHPGKVEWFASHAPSFIDIDGTEPDLPLIVDGHFVRARLGSATPAEISQWRTELFKLGARGVIIQATPASTPVRTGSVVASIDRLDDALNAYCTARGSSPAVLARAQSILSRVSA